MFKDSLSNQQETGSDDDYVELDDDQPEDKENSNPQEDQPQPALRRSTRERNPPQRYVPSFNYLLLNSGEPESYEEAMRHTFKDEW